MTVNLLELRLTISGVLRRHGIDDLAIEGEISTAVKRYLEGTIEEKRDATKVREEIQSALIMGGLEANDQDLIASRVHILLNINLDEKWDRFLEFAALRAKRGEDIDTFITWWRIHHPDPTFWSSSRMIMFWPQAFSKTEEPVKPPDEDKWGGKFVEAPHD